MVDINKHNEFSKTRTYDLVKIFFRSLSIQSSWNFSSMQNIAFVFSLLPIVKKSGRNGKQIARFLTRHLSLFSTHPYLSGPVIGSVVKLEENVRESGGCIEAANLKKALMAPYAAIGDPFFGGALRPSTAIIGVIMAIKGFILAPFVFLVLYNPLHLWVRLKGFIEGYRDGRGAVDFVRNLNLPERSRQIKWISVVLLGFLAGAVLSVPSLPYISNGEILGRLVVLVIILLCFWMIKRGISPVLILYGSSILFLIISL